MNLSAAKTAETLFGYAALSRYHPNSRQKAFVCANMPCRLISRCNVRTRCKILSLRPFPAPSAAHLPAPHCGPLPPCRALFARADGFTSASTVSLFAFMLARALCDVKSFFKITAFPQKSKRGTGRLAGGPCVGQRRAALLFLAKYKT